MRVSFDPLWARAEGSVAQPTQPETEGWTGRRNRGGCIVAVGSRMCRLRVEGSVEDDGNEGGRLFRWLVREAG